MLAASVRAPIAAASRCEVSDGRLRLLRHTVCSSLVQQDTVWCGTYWSNVTAKQDWPNQAVYMLNLVRELYANDTCLATPYARDTVRWLDSPYMSDPLYDGSNFMNTFEVFQVQYYDMPRRPGVRIEAPDTLGRKCWAFAYLHRFWDRERLERRLAAAGLAMPHFVNGFNRSLPLTMGLCDKVIANCFVNASYDPRRNGTCPGKVALFHYLGFERENLLRGFELRYPFPDAVYGE